MKLAIMAGGAGLVGVSLSAVTGAAMPVTADPVMGAVLEAIKVSPSLGALILLVWLLLKHLRQEAERSGRMEKDRIERFERMEKARMTLMARALRLRAKDEADDTEPE